MTYCLSMLCEDGIVFMSDSRSNAGMDNITVHRKMHVFEAPGDRVICILSSGNLSLTQTALALIEEDLLTGAGTPEHPHLMNQLSMFETARYVGSKVRQLASNERSFLEKDDFKFNIHLLVGGQIKSLPHQVYYIYPQGNVMHASVDSPFLQIGESKYGKPILDRGLRHDSTLDDAIKLGILSFDATMKSNVSVGPPIDILCYERDSLRVSRRLRIDESSVYLREIRDRWSSGLSDLVQAMPALEFPAEPLRLDDELDAG